MSDTSISYQNQETAPLNPPKADQTNTFTLIHEDANEEEIFISQEDQLHIPNFRHNQLENEHVSETFTATFFKYETLKEIVSRLLMLYLHTPEITHRLIVTNRRIISITHEKWDSNTVITTENSNFIKDLASHVVIDQVYVRFLFLFKAFRGILRILTFLFYIMPLILIFVCVIVALSRSTFLALGIMSLLSLSIAAVTSIVQTVYAYKLEKVKLIIHILVFHFIFLVVSILLMIASCIVAITELRQELMVYLNYDFALGGISFSALLCYLIAFVLLPRYKHRNPTIVKLEFDTSTGPKTHTVLMKNAHSVKAVQMMLQQRRDVADLTAPVIDQ